MARAEKAFKVECQVKKLDLSTNGTGSSLRRAEQAAAQAMLRKSPALSAHAAAPSADQPTQRRKSSLLNRVLGRSSIVEQGADYAPPDPGIPTGRLPVLFLWMRRAAQLKSVMHRALNRRVAEAARDVDGAVRGGSGAFRPEDRAALTTFPKDRRSLPC
jgi:hypothetical protein